MFVYQWLCLVPGLFVFARSLLFDQSDQKNRDFSHLEMIEDDEIPLEVIQQVLENVTNFFDAADTADQESLSSILNQFMDNNGAVIRDDDEPAFRSESIEKAKWAKCEPELKAVKCSYDPQYIQLPSCIRLKQCGGCCMHSKLECRPSSVRTRLFEVKRLSYAGNGEWAKPKNEVVKLDEHLACKCSCKVTAADCSALQVYNQTKCRCECRPDSDDRVKCLQRDSTGNDRRFVWDEQKCECRCRHPERECGGSSTAYFDTNRCQCVRSLISPKRLARPNNYSNLTIGRDESTANRHKYHYNTNSGSSGAGANRR